VRIGASAPVQHRLHEVFVAAGEQAIVTAQAASKSPHVDVTAATAWTQGLLIFDHTPLSDVVREFNRQNGRSLVLVGQDLPRLEISGTFPASGDERIVRFLMERFGVKVDEDEREIRISPR
jgi:transmembrane sensor